MTSVHLPYVSTTTFGRKSALKDSITLTNRSFKHFVIVFLNLLLKQTATFGWNYINRWKEIKFLSSY